MTDLAPIIVFDSGIGGQSIYRPLKIALRDQNIIYFSDPAHFPYGDKSGAWLAKRFRELTPAFKALNPSLFVLACNTATTNIISQLRRDLPCPVVGVEPVIKPLSTYQSALALMTHATATSPSTTKLLKQYGAHIHVYTPPGLATAIEYNDYIQVKKNIHEIKKIVHKHKVSAVGLSCTHYPLILPLLQQAMPTTTFIEPSSAIVKEVIRVLRLKHHENIS